MKILHVPLLAITGTPCAIDSATTVPKFSVREDSMAGEGRYA
jgi:hypothetical protein